MTTENPNFAPAAAPTEPTSYVEALVGENKKYATTEEALKGLHHAQSHITKLEEEAAQLRNSHDATVAEQKTIAEILAAIDAKKTEQPQTALETITPAVAQTVPTVNMEEVDLEALVQEVIRKDHSVRQTEQNFNQAVRTLDAKYGSRDKTNQEVAKRATELGVGVEFLKDLAQRSPDGFLTVMASSPSKPADVSPIPTGINTSSLLKHAPGGPPPAGTYRWYQELKKSNPKQYRQLYSQQMQAMSTDPDKFYERTQ